MPWPTRPLTNSPSGVFGGSLGPLGPLDLSVCLSVCVASFRRSVGVASWLVFVSHVFFKLQTFVALVIAKAANQLIDVVDFSQMFFEHGFICDFVDAKLTSVLESLMNSLDVPVQVRKVFALVTTLVTFPNLSPN